jgi:hypothetical protein
MQNLIELVRDSVSDGATTEQRQAGAQACRTILAALDAEKGKPIAVAEAPAPSPLAMLGQLDSGTALDLLIAKLRAALPAEPNAAPKRDAFKVQLVPMPRK